MCNRGHLNFIVQSIYDSNYSIQYNIQWLYSVAAWLDVPTTCLSIWMIGDWILEIQCLHSVLKSKLIMDVRLCASVHWKFQFMGFMSSLNQSYRLSKPFAKVLFIHHKKRKHKHIPNSISTDLTEKKIWNSIKDIQIMLEYLNVKWEYKMFKCKDSI